MTRTRIGLTLGTAVFAVTGLIGLAACGQGSATVSPAAAVADAAPAEAQLLAAMGFETGAQPVADPVVDASTVPSAGPSAAPKARKPGQRKALGRQLLRRNTLHGSVVMKTKDGTKTVDVQRGTVTAIDSRTVSVKSTDGVTLTWTFGSPIHVLERRTAVQPSAVKVGTEIGVAGARNGSTTTASLMVIR
jgi:hypothetical protein